MSDLARRAERLSQWTPQQVLPQLQARRQLGRAVAALVGNLAHRPRQLRSLTLVLGHAQGGSAAQRDVQLEVGVAQSLRQRRELREAFEPVGRSDAACRGASSREVSSATRSCAAEAEGRAWSTMRSTSSAARASSAAPAAAIEKRTARSRVAGGERVMREKGMLSAGAPSAVSMSTMAA